MKTSMNSICVVLLALGSVAMVTLSSGCTRNPPPDDRTLEQKPLVETSKPTDKNDPFRP